MQQSVDIARPLEEVFAFVANPGHDARWGANLAEVSQLLPGPLGVGTRFRYTARFAGRPFQLVREVTAYEPNRRQAVKTISGPCGGAARGPLRRSGAAPGSPSAVAVAPAASSAWLSRCCCAPPSGR